jgi:hypothetical protein
MSDRRSLVEGFKATPSPLDVAKEKQLVFEEKESSPPAPVQRQLAPISTRLRADFVSAIKRASLERQLKGTEPNTMRNILEEAIEPWLRDHGYLQ